MGNTKHLFGAAALIATLFAPMVQAESAPHTEPASLNKRSPHSLGTLSTFGLVGYRYTHLGTRFSPFLTVGLFGASVGVDIYPISKGNNLSLELHAGEHTIWFSDNVIVAGFNLIWHKSGASNPGPALGVGAAYLKDYRSCSLTNCQRDSESVWVPSITYYFKI